MKIKNKVATRTRASDTRILNTLRKDCSDCFKSSVIQLPVQRLGGDSLTPLKVSPQPFYNRRPQTMCPSGTDLPGLTYGAVKRRALYSTLRLAEGEETGGSRNERSLPAQARQDLLTLGQGSRVRNGSSCAPGKNPACPRSRRARAQTSPKVVRANDESSQSLAGRNNRRDFPD